MGISASFGELLVHARQNGAGFDNLCTIGRQGLAIPVNQLRKMAHSLGAAEPDWTGFSADGYADDFFRHILGARSIQSVDYSDYQHADLVHDLNTPLPESWEDRFDALIDGGSIEHIFDIRQVLTNYMESVKVGGNVFLMTTANNMCGHGFYQFSPEFFYRVFAQDNGFEVVDMAMIESPLLTFEASRWYRIYRVNDPAKMKRRVQLVNKRPVMIYVHARRIAHVPVFEKPPLQSDYKMLKWNNEPQTPRDAGTTGRRSTAGKSFRYLTVLRELRKRLLQRRKNSFGNRRFFSDKIN